MFSGDAHALVLAKQMLHLKLDGKLHPLMRIFAYLPFEHSENIDDQITSVDLFLNLFKEQCSNPDAPVFENCLDYAKRHRKRKRHMFILSSY